MAEDMIIEENASITEGTVDSVQSSNMIVEEEEEPESELDNYWKAVNNDPRDFTSWTYLLDFVEKGDDIENARRAFDQFLARYPYCYGYWKKYAELEKRHHDLERCIEVYERGVKAIPLSVDLWTAYLDTALDIYQTSEDFEWTIKSIYERAIDAAGLEFRSDKLWEHYISWTTNNGRLSDATKIYDQLLQTTTQMYYQNWENFKKHVEDNETSSIIPPEELEIWKERVMAGRQPLKEEPDQASATSAFGTGVETKMDMDTSSKKEATIQKDENGLVVDDSIEKKDECTSSRTDDPAKRKEEADEISEKLKSAEGHKTVSAVEEPVSREEHPSGILGDQSPQTEPTSDRKKELNDEKEASSDKTEEPNDGNKAEAIANKIEELNDGEASSGITKEPSDGNKAEAIDNKVEELNDGEASSGKMEEPSDGEKAEAIANRVEGLNDNEASIGKAEELNDKEVSSGKTEEPSDDNKAETIANKIEGLNDDQASSDKTETVSGTLEAAVTDNIQAAVTAPNDKTVAASDKTTMSNQTEALNDKEAPNFMVETVNYNTEMPSDKSETPDGKPEGPTYNLEASNYKWEASKDEILTTSESLKDEVKDIHNGESAVSAEEIVKKLATELTSSDWSLIKTKFMEDREQIYQKTYEQITKRWYFEEKIRRPYFHVKPLEKSQLANWREYLDMEISEGDFRRVCSLFERCLIACALYEEFWVRYATYLESLERNGDARRVWENACTVHLPHRPFLHWRWALFEERQNNPKGAVEVMNRGYRDCPANVKLCVRRLSLLRRSGTLSAESLCAEYESAIERFASENIACASLLSLKYARHLNRERGDREQAERVLREAIARDETNERLYLQLIDLNYRQPSIDWKACDRVLAWIVGLTSLPRRLRLRFCQRRYEMLEESSDDVAGITSALQMYEELQREIEGSGEHEGEVDASGMPISTELAVAANDGEADGDGPPSKRARTTSSNVTGAISADAMAYSGTAYDSMGYHHYGTAAGGVAAGSAGGVSGGDAMGMACGSESTHHLDSTGYGSAATQGHSAASNPQAYAAAAAAAAANAAYPGGSGNAAWDSYYNSYYGYYAGYYGATGTGEHSDWQTQASNS